MLCDAHIHFIPKEISEHTAFYRGVWADKDKLYRFLDENKIQKALLVYPSTDASLKLGSLAKECEIYNKALEAIIRENPKMIASCLIDVDNLSEISSRIGQLKEKGFKAINLASSYNGSFIIDKLKRLFAAAQKYSLPIFIHPQTINPIGFERVKDPLLMPVLEYSFDISICLGLLMVEGILEEFQIKFILSSLGGVVPFLKERFDRVYLMLKERGIVKDLGKSPSEILKNVYVDTSGATLGNINLALDLFGEDKILFGTDYPVNPDLNQNLKMLDKLGSGIKEKITSKNFLNIFK